MSVCENGSDRLPSCPGLCRFAKTEVTGCPLVLAYVSIRILDPTPSLESLECQQFSEHSPALFITDARDGGVAPATGNYEVLAGVA